MDVLKRALENIRRMWGALAPTQRVLLAAAAALMAALLAWSSTGSASEAMVRVVGREVDESTRARVLQRLQQGQRHEIRDREIYVPRKDADRIILELAGEGVLGDDAVWKFLEQDNIFATGWDREKRLQVALQRRLEQMIRKIESVRNASVVINPGTRSSQLGFSGPKASASVMVELSEGAALNRKNVQAIAGLVARAVPGVEFDQVHISDTRGNPYRATRPDSGSASAVDHRGHERDIELDIQERIKGYLPRAMVVVRVMARSSEVETEDLQHTNPKAVETVERKEVQKGGGAAAPTGIKGEAAVSPAAESAGGTSSTVNETTEKNVLDVRRKRERDPAGAIQKITVGVLIPVEAGADGKELAEAEKLLPRYKDWVMAAAGPQADEKSVSVQLIPSKRPEPVAGPSMVEGAMEWISAYGGRVALFALALFGLLGMLKVLRSAMPRDTVEDLGALTAAITQSVERAVPAGGAPGGAELDLKIPAESDVIRLKQGIKEMVGKNPQNVATSLKAFLGGQAK
jgi:flagellar M-ring protein FliF